MYKVIQKHKNYAGIWLAVGCMALAFCFMFGKDTIETEYYTDCSAQPKGWQLPCPYFYVINNQ